MSPMLGEQALPESVNDLRRRLRSSVRSVRAPIRQRRQDLVPGPDIIGRAESTAMDLTDRLATRDTLLDRMSNSDMTNSNSSSDGGNNSGGSPPAT